MRTKDRKSPYTKQTKSIKNSLFHTVGYKNHSVGYIFHTVKYKSRTVKQRICKAVTRKVIRWKKKFSLPYQRKWFLLPSGHFLAQTSRKNTANFIKKGANVLEISKFFLPLHSQTRDMYPRETSGVLPEIKDGPFVYRLGRKIFILERGVRFPHGLHNKQKSRTILKISRDGKSQIIY